MKETCTAAPMVVGRVRLPAGALSPAALAAGFSRSSRRLTNTPAAAPAPLSLPSGAFHAYLHRPPPGRHHR